MNIWYFNHYAVPPGFGNPGRPYYLAKSLANFGHEVIIFHASTHHFLVMQTSKEMCLRVNTYNDVKYIQFPTRPYTGNGLGRLLNMVDYSLQVKSINTKLNLGNLKKPDIIILSSPHLLAYPRIKKLSNIIGNKIIVEIRDIWPLSLIELAGVSPKHPFVLFLKFLERKAYRSSDALVSLLPKAVDHMVPLGLAPEHFNYIPNGIDISEWHTNSISLPREHKKVFLELRKKNKFIVVYAGSIGIPNAMDQVLDLAKVTQTNQVPYHFVFIGDGIEKSKLLKRVKDENISFITFLPKISKTEVIKALQLSDLCFIGWKKHDIYKYGISPNKIGDYFMSSKPILHAVQAGNDPVQEAGAGISIEPYNARLLNKTLIEFVKMPKAQREEMGENGRLYAIKKLDWNVLGAKYENILLTLVDTK